MILFLQFMVERLSLRKVHDGACLKPPEERHWYGPFNVVCKWLLEAHDMAKGGFLVLGCGYGREAFGIEEIWYQAERDGNPRIVGVDIDPEAVVEADERENQGSHLLINSADGSCFLVGDITDGELAERLKEQFGLFSVVLLIGVVDNLLDREEVLAAFALSWNLLSPQGHIIVADFAKPTGDDLSSWWEERYARDEGALRSLGLEDVEGVIVVRPGGLRKSTMSELNVADIAGYLEQGEFEKLVRHWPIETVMNLLGQVRFLHVRGEARTARWDTPRRLESYFSEDSRPEGLLLGYGIMARKISY
jgi:SAM-dependent methyltransferase